MNPEETTDPEPPSPSMRRPQRRCDAPNRRVVLMTRAVAGLLARLPERLFGVDCAAVLAGATQVRAARLRDEDKVRVTGHELLVERACLEDIARHAESDEVAAVHAQIYVLHELAHLPQGIGAYATVTALHALGEDEILDLDLAADHFAALAVSLVERRSIVELKALQSQSLCAYPVTRSHTPAARLRKARRAVSLRADVALRRHGLLGDADGYVVANFGAPDAPLALMVRGQGATRLIPTSPLSAADTAQLHAAADASDDPHGTLDHLDAVLDRALRPAAAAA